MRKGFFVCDWDYTLFWPTVAEKLKAQNEIASCSALVVGRNFYTSLLANPHPFDATYLLQDSLENFPETLPGLEEKLERLEKDYGNPTLWRFVWADRSWVRTTNTAIKIKMVKCFEYLEELFDREKPDVLFTNAFASMPHLVLFEVAKKRGIKVVRPLALRLSDYYILSDNAMEEETWIQDYLSGDKPLSQSSQEKAKQFLVEFREKAVKPKYQVLRKNEYDFSLARVGRFFRYIYRYWFSGAFKK